MQENNKSTSTAFDPAKPVQTRDGRPARILATDLKGESPICALISWRDDYDDVVFFHADGRHHYRSNLDLVNIPEKHVRWMGVWRVGSQIVFAGTGFTRQEVLRNSLAMEEFGGWGVGKLIACVKVEFTEGEGLEEE